MIYQILFAAHILSYILYHIASKHDEFVLIEVVKVSGWSQALASQSLLQVASVLCPLDLLVVRCLRMFSSCLRWQVFAAYFSRVFMEVAFWAKWQCPARVSRPACGGKSDLTFRKRNNISSVIIIIGPVYIILLSFYIHEEISTE